MYKRQAFSLDSPTLAAPGGVAVYKLRVTNTGTRTVRRVRVAQRLGRGVAPIRARGPKGTTSTVGRRAARWTLTALKGGRTATFVLKVRVGRRLAGGVTHTTASLRGTGRASATTAVVRRVGKTEQGF